MKSLKITFGLLAMAFCAITSSASAQVTLSGGADFVSSYVWRGAYGSGASVQPYAELGAGNFAIGVWGSTALETSVGAKEADYYVSYSTGGFSAMITDYWWEGEGLSYGSNHYYEGALGYTFGDSFPLTISVSTMFAGEGDKDENGDQLYSTYIGLDYPIEVGSVALDLGVGITPAAGMYADGFNVCSLSARVSKSVVITDSFELPLFVDAIVNPASSEAFLVAGFSLSF